MGKRYGWLNHLFGHYEKRHEIKPRKRKKSKPTKIYDYKGKLLFIVNEKGKLE